MLREFCTLCSVDQIEQQPAEERGSAFIPHWEWEMRNCSLIMLVQQCSCKLRWLSLNPGWQGPICQHTIPLPQPSEPWVTALHMVAYMKALRWDWNTSLYASVHISLKQERKKKKKLKTKFRHPHPPYNRRWQTWLWSSVKLSTKCPGGITASLLYMIHREQWKVPDSRTFLLHVQQRPIELLVTMDSDTLKVLWVSNALK